MTNVSHFFTIFSRHRFLSNVFFLYIIWSVKYGKQILGGVCSASSISTIYNVDSTCIFKSYIHISIGCGINPSDEGGDRWPTRVRTASLYLPVSHRYSLGSWGLRLTTWHLRPTMGKPPTSRIPQDKQNLFIPHLNSAATALHPFYANATKLVVTLVRRWNLCVIASLTVGELTVGSIFIFKLLWSNTCWARCWRFLLLEFVRSITRKIHVHRKKYTAVSRQKLIVSVANASRKVTYFSHTN